MYLSSSNSSNSVIHVNSFVTRTSFDEVRGGSNSSQSSDGPRYDWVDSSVLRIPRKFRDSNTLDQFLSETSFVKPDCPTDAVMADICCHRGPLDP